MQINCKTIEAFVERLLSLIEERGYSVSDKDVVVKVAVLLSEEEDVGVEFTSDGRVLSIHAPAGLLEELKELAEEFEREVFGEE
jgi:acetolactate synthase regulatory subunit